MWYLLCFAAPPSIFSGLQSPKIKRTLSICDVNFKKSQSCFESSLFYFSTIFCGTGVNNQEIHKIIIACTEPTNFFELRDKTLPMYRKLESKRLFHFMKKDFWMTTITLVILSIHSVHLKPTLSFSLIFFLSYAFFTFSVMTAYPKRHNEAPNQPRFMFTSDSE